MAVRVYIGTTEGPAPVQRITPEDPKVRSVICLDGKTIALPVAQSYDSFVREPTGVVEKFFGHPSYRIDVGAPIDAGNSWQLGVFAAHALFARNRLARPDAPAERAVWLTGEVDHALRVGPVVHLDEKFSRSRPLFADLQRDGIPVTIYAARDNAAVLTEAWLSHRGIDPANCRVVALDDVAGMCRDLGLPVPGAREGRGRLRAAAAFGLLALFAVVAIAFAAVYAGLPGWIDLHRSAQMKPLHEQLDRAVGSDCLTCRVFARAFRYWLDVRRPSPETIALGISEIRVTPGRSCPPDTAGVQGLVPVVRDGDGRFRPSAMPGLCALVFEVTKQGRPAFLWAFAQVVPDRTYLLADRAGIAAADEAVSEAERWSVRPPAHIDRPLRYQFVALASEDPLAATAEWMLRRLFQNRDRPYAADWATVVQALNGRGVTVVSAWHELTP